MRFTPSRWFTLCFLVVALALSSSCNESPREKTPSPKPSAPPSPQPSPPPEGVAPVPVTPSVSALAPDDPLPGMLPVLEPHDIYSETRPDKLSPVVQNFPSRLYVPNSISDTVDVIDPTTYQILESFPVGAEPQHVVPSYDMKTLWVLNNQGDSLTQIDPVTGKKGETIPVEDPYNLYYTPDGKYALVVAERLRRLDFRDPQTMRLQYSLAVPCRGVNHLDYAAHGRYLIASCEFSNELIKVDVAER